MGRLIIVEGADGTGKSTLINNLMRLCKPNRLFNYSYPIEKTKEECLAYAAGEYEASIRVFRGFTLDKMYIFCDRFHLGEYAYGPVMRGYTHEESWAFVRRIEEYMFNKFGVNEVRLIILVCDPRVAWSRVKKEEEYPNNLDQLAKINQRYKDIGEGFSWCPHIVIDTTNVNPAEVANMVSKFISEDQTEDVYV